MTPSTCLSIFDVPPFAPSGPSANQVIGMMKVCDMPLEGCPHEDIRVRLYVALREQENTNFAKMSDQVLFAEVLKILKDESSLIRLQKRYENIFPEA